LFTGVGQERRHIKPIAIAKPTKSPASNTSDAKRNSKRFPQLGRFHFQQTRERATNVSKTNEAEIVLFHGCFCVVVLYLCFS
jgi:hypothetical protein